MMTLYHGSPFRFDRPDITRSKAYRDFGMGFYLAENENDSSSIALKNSWDGYLYTFEVDDDAIFRNLAVAEFDGYDENWLRFVYECRMQGTQNMYDVIIGPTAGGPVNDLFEQYRREQAPYEDVCKILAHEITGSRFGIQWCLASEGALDYIELMDIESLGRD